MAGDFSIKPVGAPVAAPFITPLPDAARDAVRTELPPGKSVTPSGQSGDTSLAASYDSKADSDRIAHQVIVDRAASEIVYVSIDKTTNQVVNQYPEASKLRARAYFREQDQAKIDSKALATDRRA
jgi:hypothetical protein